MRSKVCNVQCDGKALGYSYCQYTDCSNAAGNFLQVVSECDPRTATRQVKYALKAGSTCIYHADSIGNIDIAISCAHTPFLSPMGAFEMFLALVGICVCSALLVATWYYRDQKTMRGSQLVFVYVFLLGAIGMNVSIFFFIGMPSDAMCLLRPWAYYAQYDGAIRFVYIYIYSIIRSKFWVIGYLIFSIIIARRIYRMI